MASSFFMQSNASAYDGGQLIDDATFLNAASMNEPAIQNFLVGKNSGLKDKYFYFDCASTGMSDSYYKSAGAPCNQNVRAATIIYYAAQIYGINPQVVLATLQKEQGLITSPSPTDWAINQAMGYGCPDSGGCGASNFLYQIDNGTWLLRYHMERARGNMDYWWHSTSWVCGTPKNYYTPGLYPKQNVNFYDDNGTMYRTHFLNSAATSSMYCYTPHAYNNPQGLYGLPPYGTIGQYYSGSFNFVLWYERWFGSTISGVKLSPLYKSSDTQQIFAVYGKTKYPFSSPEVMASFGLNRSPVMTVTSAYLSNYTTGPMISASLAKKMYDPSGTIYFFDDGKRFPLTMESCKADPSGKPITNTTWGLDCFNADSTLTLPNELIDDFTVEDIPLSPLAINNGTVWLMEGGKKRPVVSPLTVDAYGGWGKTKWMQDYHMMQPVGKMVVPENAVVKFSDSPQLYVFNNNNLQPINDMAQYYTWRLDSSPFLFLSAATNAADPLAVSSTPLESLVKTPSGKTYVALMNGRKVPTESGTPLAFDLKYYTSISDSLAERLPTSSTPKVFRSTDGTIFQIISTKLRTFPTIDDFTYSGFTPNDIAPVTPSVRDALMYGGFTLSPGRLIKVKGEDSIRYVRGEGDSLYVPSSNMPGLPYDKLITVDTETGLRYPINGVYRQ